MLWLFVQLFSVYAVGYSTISVLLDPYFDTGTNSVGDSKSKYTESEQNALKQFRVMVNDTLDKDYERIDSFLIPWLRASHLNLAEANKMLRAAKKWRKDYGMDTIVNETVFHLKTTRKPCSIDGISKQGNPVVILNFGGVDLRKWVLLGKSEDMSRAIIKCLEETVVKIRELARTTGKDITQSVAIMDFEGYSIKQHACMGCVRMYLDFFRIVESFYPQLAKHLVAINAPVTSKSLIDISKVVMSEHTGKVLKIFGTNKEEWSKYLLHIISADQLPIRYGGTREDV